MKRHYYCVMLTWYSCQKIGQELGLTYHTVKKRQIGFEASCLIEFAQLN